MALRSRGPLRPSEDGTQAISPLLTVCDLDCVPSWKGVTWAVIPSREGVTWAVTPSREGVTWLLSLPGMA